MYSLAAIAPGASVRSIPPAWTVSMKAARMAVSLSTDITRWTRVARWATGVR
ncbi:hypothetical protein SAMN06296028_11013 [Kocuria indica]|uniref:Uncharacterized protein n=1 Tax=Kocuria marina subsp. indica TaxID=1049583 RepID=A0A1X7D9R0_9MICC|nr:hypothetical protein SAMN06296028_11013 [Kocuria indica]